MRTKAKVTAALLVVLVTALMTTAILAYFIYERTLSGLVTSRFEFVAKELKRKIEDGLDLGLPIGELENVNELLRQQISTDDALLDLTIQNAKGAVLFDTDSARIGITVDRRWLPDIEQSDQDSSRTYLTNSEIRVPLVNSFGKVVGGLVVTYSQAYYDKKRAQAIGSIVETTTIVLLVGSFIGLAGALVISSPVDREVVRLEASLRTILARVGARSDDHMSGARDLKSEVGRFEDKLLNAVTALEKVEAAVAASQSAPSGTR
jgi:hypothetical protein